MQKYDHHWAAQAGSTVVGKKPLIKHKHAFNLGQFVPAQVKFDILWSYLTHGVAGVNGRVRTISVVTYDAH
jgi:hypothetical protein